MNSPKALILGILILITITTRLLGQLTPPPEALPPMVLTNPVAITIPKPRLTTFTVSCPYGHGKFHLPGIITTNGGHPVPGGGIIERTVHFCCPVGMEQFDAKNEKFVPEAIAVEDPPDSGGTANTPLRQTFGLVVSDTTPPVVGSFAVAQSNITNFTNHVLFSARLVGNGSWTDPETGAFASKIWDVSWPVNSNEFYTAWCTANLNSAWHEFPTSTNIHPAKSNWTYSTYFPILTNGSRFYTVRSKSGNGVTYQ